MKQLIWKELREQRYIPMAHAALVMVLVTVAYAVCLWASMHDQGTKPLTADGAMSLLPIALVIVGLFSGSGAFAPETGNRTVEFLATLPIGRRRIWWSKFAAGIISIAASYIAVIAAYVIVALILFGGPGLSNFAIPYAGEVQVLILAISLLGYSACLYVSTLVDRTVVAVAVGLIVAACVAALAIALLATDLIKTSRLDGSLLMGGIFAAMTVVFLAASHACFCSGSILQPASRVRPSVVVLAVGLVIVATVLTGYGVVTNRAYAAEQARQLADLSRMDGPSISFEYTTHPGMKCEVSFHKQSKKSSLVFQLYLLRPDEQTRTIGLEDRLGLAMPIDWNWGSTPDAVPTLSHDSDKYVASTVFRHNTVALLVWPHPKPGTYVDHVTVDGADHKPIGVIDIVNHS